MHCLLPRASALLRCAACCPANVDEAADGGSEAADGDGGATAPRSAAAPSPVDVDEVHPPRKPSENFVGDKQYNPPAPETL